MSVLCLYLCVCRPMSVANIGPYTKTRSSYPITFYNARRQQSSRTAELVDHTYDGRRLARRTHTSVDSSALQHYFDLVWVCCGPCSYNDAAVDKILFDIACRSVSAVEELLGYSWYRGNVQTPGPLVLWLSSKSIVLRHLSIAQVVSRLCLPDFLQPFFLGKS